MNKHTPGPWLVIGSEVFTGLGAENAEGIASRSDEGWMIADCDAGSLSLDEVKANTALIAAAPDLLEALEVCLQCEERPGIIKMAELAIAKAKGE